MSYPDPATSAPSRHRFEQVAAVVGESGAMVLATTSAVDAVLAVSTQLGAVGFVAWNTLEVVAFCALITGLAGLASSRAAGAGWFAGAGLVTAFLGIGAFAMVGLLTYVDRSAGERWNLVAISVTAVGMVLTGLAVLRARRWHGWHRFMPLLCGLYAAAVELPSFLFLRHTGVFEYVVVGNWLTWVALNVGLWLATPALVRSRPGLSAGR